MILVTGGAGFIGSRLVNCLVDIGLDPVVLDDLSGGDVRSLPGGVRLVEADISDPGVVEIISRLAPEAVIHTAAQVSVAASSRDPSRDRVVNVEGTANVISGAVSGGASRLVFVSSGGAVYGDCDGATEHTLPGPASYYGSHKYLAERYVELSGLSYAIARLANVYGPGQRADLEGGVVSIFLRLLSAGGPVTINGGGDQRRDFVYVDDVVDALLTMLYSHKDGLYNVGTGESTSVSELLRACEAVTRPATETRSALPKPGDVRESRLLSDHLTQELGWTPHHSLLEGLKKTAQSPHTAHSYPFHSRH